MEEPEGEEEITLLEATARQRPASKGQGKPGPWGVLTLTPRHLSFRQGSDSSSSEDDVKGVRVALSDVSAHFVTPPSAKLICLKITADTATGDEGVGGGSDVDASKKRPKVGAEFVFEFTAGASTDRDSFRDLIAQLVPPQRRLKRLKATPSPSSLPAEEVSVEVARKRAALLEGNEEARDLYQRLVVSGVITSQEFWQSREHMIDAEAQHVSQQQTAKQDEGVAGSGEVKPVAESDTSVQYKLTAADIRRIFTEQPAVKKAFDEWVQFWTKYFQSKYFHRTSGGQKPTDESRQEEEDRSDTRRSARKDDKGDDRPDATTGVRVKREEDVRRRLAGIDLSSDLTRSDETDPNDKKGYGMADQGEAKPKDAKKLTLLQKINRHATSALGEIERAMGKREGLGEGMMDIDISTSSLTAKDPITKSRHADADADTDAAVAEPARTAGAGIEPMKASEARLAEATRLPELEGREDTNYVALAIQDQRRYFQDTSLVTSSSSSSSSVGADAAELLEDAVALFRSEVETVRQNRGGRAGPIMGQREASNVISYGMSPTELKMLVDYNERATELLRHFWRCYPLSSRALATKAAKVGAAIEELKEEIEAVASKKAKGKGRKAQSAVASEVLLSITRSLAKAIDMRNSH